MEADREARGRDRRRATKQVKEALARGHIVAADADLRLMQVASATMLSDLDRLVRDLDPAAAADPWPTGPAGPAAGPPTSPPPVPAPTDRPAPVAAGPSSAPRRDAGAPGGPVFAGPAPTSRPGATGGTPWAPGAGPVMKPRRRRKASPVAIVVVGAALVASFVSRADDQEAQEATSIGSGELLTEWGFREVVGAVEERTGQTEVLDLTLHPTYADVVVPDGPRGRTGSTFRYDGSGLVQQGASDARGPRLDLALVDARAVTVAVREAEARLDDPTGTYVELLPGRRGPDLRTVTGDGRGAAVVVRSTADGRLRSITGP